MSRVKFFIIISATVFILERILLLVTNWPVFIFPVFVIIFLLTSRHDAYELVYVVPLALIFDFLSGYGFGFTTIAILAVALLIYFFKTRFNVEPGSFLALAIHSLIFTFIYFAILSIRSRPILILDQAVIITTETLILFFVFRFLLRYVSR